MHLSSPLVPLASALHHAALVSLPTVSYDTRDYEAMYLLSTDEQQRRRKSGTFPIKTVTRRPAADECIVAAMFPETWGSTALGFGGIGGAAMTTAYTVVIQGPSADYAVYWNGSFAYLVPPSATEEQRIEWQADLGRGTTVSREAAVAKYGALFPDGPSSF